MCSFSQALASSFRDPIMLQREICFQAPVVLALDAESFEDMMNEIFSQSLDLNVPQVVFMCRYDQSVGGAEFSFGNTYLIQT
jgi:hypothetical protein